MELFTSKYINLKNNERVYIIYLPHSLLIVVSSDFISKEKNRFPFPNVYWYRQKHFAGRTGNVRHISVKTLCECYKK